jgi:hypothetical protein
LLAVAALAAASCGSTSPLATACAPGQTVACECPSGAASLKICAAQGSYGACACGDGGAAGASGASGDGGVDAAGTSGAAGAAGTGSGGSGGTVSDGAAGTGGAVDAGTTSDADPGPTGCVPSGKLIGGPETLIDLFPIDAGILVVRADAILLVGRDGTVKKTVTAPRPITTASFDGTSLVVGDAAMITVYSPALESRGTVLLTEACASSVLMDGNIFVCGPTNDWDRIFYTYNVSTLKPIARSTQKFTYHGVPMRRVAGTSYFITVSTGSSPSDFYLYNVLPGGSDVAFVNESPYHGDFPVSMTFGFDGTPAAHVVNVDGLLLKIFGDLCDAQHYSSTSGCFVKDGNLGILPAGRSFRALSNDAAGRLFAVTNDSTSYAFDPLCPGGCNVQLIDVAARTVVSQRKHLMAARRFIGLRPDKSCKMVALGYEVATSTSSTTYGGYQIDLVDYGEK